MADVRPDKKTYATEFVRSDTHRGVLLTDLITDNLVTAVINLGAEVWISRRRSMIVERLLEEHGKVTAELIEQYTPSEEVTAMWERERDAFVRRIFDVLARRGDVPINSAFHPEDDANAKHDKELVAKFYYY